MGNANVKPHPKPRTKKQVRWKAADRPSPPGKPSLIQENSFVPDVIHISWSKPIKDGGSPVSYLVEHKRLGATHWTTSNTSPVSKNDLIVNGLEPGWRYQFRVRAENVVGLSDPSEISEPFTVNLQRTVITPPKFTEELKDVIVLENERVDLEVHFLGQPSPNICWFKDGFEIFSGNRTRITTVSDKSVLTVLRTSAADEGEIKCTGTNRAGHASTKCKLTIEAPPVIRLPKLYQDPDGIIFEIGETIKLNVTISGRPTPLIFWSHNGESIQNDDRHELEYNDKSASLKIENAIRTDRGEFQVRAVNKLGQNIASFLVTITNKPTPPGRARVLLTAGRSVTLSWSTPEDDGGCKIGNYIIEYYRLGWDVWLKAATSRQLSTQLGDLIEGSQYKFRVKAESPYGVSEPSEESETVFIPDHKRGINEPNDVLEQIENQPEIPMEYPRRRRAESSPRVSFAFNDDTPARPERKKTGKTPEASPRLRRKQILDTPESPYDEQPSSTIRKFSLPLPILKYDQRSRSSSPKQSPQDSPSSPINRQGVFFPEVKNNFQRDKTKSPSPEIIITDTEIPNVFDNDIVRENEMKKVFSQGEDNHSSTANGNRIRPPLTRQEFSGSSEFMLVLCPEGEQGAHLKKLGINFEENLIPPPLSLSAPELGIEPPDQPFLRRSASSTELLNYRLMERLNEAAIEEEMRQNDNNKKPNLEIPLIQVNSKEIIGLEKKPSTVIRRMSTGVVTHHQTNTKWSHRRQSLKNSNDSTSENKLHKFEDTEENRKEILEYRINENIKDDEKEWVEDYEESIQSDEDVESSLYEDDEETYNPRSKIVTSNSQSLADNKPFEILTVRKEPPDVNMKPKPILKKTQKILDKNSILQLDKTNYSREHTRSPFSIENQKNERSNSLIDSLEEQKIIDDVNKSPKRRSFSSIPGQMKEAFKGKNKNEPKTGTNKTNPLMNISALASATSIAGASFVIPEKMENKKDSEEEAKVVVDFYGDIVKSFGGKTKPTAEYSRTMIPKYDTYEERKISEIKSNIESQPEKFRAPTPSIENSTQALKFERQDTARDTYTPQFVMKNPDTHEIKTKIQEFENYYRTPSKSPIRQSRIHEKSKSPSPREISAGRNKFEQTSSRSSSVARRKKVPRSRDASTSPVRFENWENRSSRSSLERDYYNKRSLNSSRDSSLTRRTPSPRPMLREITTQTSFRIESRTPANILRKQEELAHKAEKRVKGVFEYFTDLAMISVAGWLYLFQNEYLAIPFLLILVYRQLNEKFSELKEKIKKRVPKWIAKRFNHKS